MYTANSGGYTADANYIFKLNKPYLVAHPDPLSLEGKMSSWKKTFTVDEVEKKAQKNRRSCAKFEKDSAYKS